MTEILQILIRIKKKVVMGLHMFQLVGFFFLGFVCLFVSSPTTPQFFSNIALMRTAQEGFCNKWWQVPRIGLNSKKAAQNTTKPKSKWKCDKKFRSKCFSWNLVIFLSKKREYVACFLFYFLQLCEISHPKKGWFQHVSKNMEGCFIFLAFVSS